MSAENGFGWRPITKGTSSGLDFLGLAVPIEGILDAETSGITNATFRARYFSLVPWYYWKYAMRGGKGSARDQRQFAIGFEMLIAYANIARLDTTESTMTGIIRRDFCERKWKEGKTTLPLRGDEVGDTPSPTDAALYGPSLRRLNLLGRHGQFQTCRKGGAIFAEELDKTLGKVDGFARLMDATTVNRETVELWAQKLYLLTPSKRENELLRALLFGSDPFAREELAPRVYTMLLLLDLARTGNTAFTASDMEVALASGLDLAGQSFRPEASLGGAYRRWRILALLKLLRHSSELAFYAVHTHVRSSTIRFGTAQHAAEELIASAVSKSKGLPKSFERLVGNLKDTAAPAWDPPKYDPEEMVRHALSICAWCAAVLRTDSGKDLLAEDVATVGAHLDADLAGYFERLNELLAGPTTVAMRWLCVDRGLARHFQVAARKLAQHDTFRLIEDEDGMRATEKCPIPNIAIRVDSMLSLLSDVGLLRIGDEGYLATAETTQWYNSHIKRLHEMAGCG
jgi:hypothetical protein